jgi:plastocyanin
MSIQRSILLAALVAAAACSDDDDDGGQGPGNDTEEGDVLVRNNSFDPSQLQVETGATVVWAWASNGVEHNVTFDDGTASGNRSDGTFQRTFAAAGDYPYRCTIHAGMTGSINVADAPTSGDGGEGGTGGGGGGGGGDPYDY